MSYTYTDYQPDIAIHPGETLEDALLEVGLSQTSLAQRTGLTEKHISQIVNGKASITPETAIKLERVGLGSASFWNNLDKNYHETKARLEAKDSLKSEIELAKNFNCYNEIAKLGYIPKTRSWSEKAEHLLRFFGVDSLRFVSMPYAVAYRKYSNSASKYSLAAWLRCGELEADQLTLSSFDKVKLKDQISEFRRLTHNPDGFAEKLQKICAGSGLAVVFTPYFPKTQIHGAFRWVNNKPLIQLNTKGAFSDIFWFSFFHELGHALLHGKKEEFLDFKLEDTDAKEAEANKFASRSLIPEANYRSFVENGNFSISSINLFAKSIDIAMSIVCGRLAHDGYISWKKVSHARPRLSFKNV